MSSVSWPSLVWRRFFSSRKRRLITISRAEVDVPSFSAAQVTEKVRGRRPRSRLPRRFGKGKANSRRLPGPADYSRLVRNRHGNAGRCAFAPFSAFSISSGPTPRAALCPARTSWASPVWSQGRAHPPGTVHAGRGAMEPGACVIAAVLRPGCRACLGRCIDKCICPAPAGPRAYCSFAAPVVIMPADAAVLRSADSFPI
jgi:hypothetical protein